MRYRFVCDIVYHVADAGFAIPAAGPVRGVWWGGAQINDINKAIRAAKPGDLLYKVPPVEDPSEDIIKAAVEACEWNLRSRRHTHTVKDLAFLHRQSRILLDLLKDVFPEKSGQAGEGRWDFEKAHSIMHVCREIIMFGFRENTTAQGPESAHIANVKKIARQTNNKQVFLTLMKHHAKESMLQNMQERMIELRMAGLPGDEALPQTAAGGADAAALLDSAMQDAADRAERHSSRNESLACELGWRYPHLMALMTRRGLNKGYYTRIRVRAHGRNNYATNPPPPYISWHAQSVNMSYHISHTILHAIVCDTYTHCNFRRRARRYSANRCEAAIAST